MISYCQRKTKNHAHFCQNLSLGQKYLSTDERWENLQLPGPGKILCFWRQRSRSRGWGKGNLVEGKHISIWGDIRSIGAGKRIEVGLPDLANKNIKLPIKFVLNKEHIFKHIILLHVTYFHRQYIL